jgi:hypothetical protein
VAAERAAVAPERTAPAPIDTPVRAATDAPRVKTDWPGLAQNASTPEPTRGPNTLPANTGTAVTVAKNTS